MMTNAGRTRSFGAEVSLRAELHRNLHAWASYGYTNARFRRFVDGTEDYAGNHIPYAPEHTLSVGATYSVPLSVSWAERFVVEANCTGAGRIYWNEANDLSQPFYALLGGSLGIEGRRWAVSAWVRNATQTPYDVFYFASMGNRFLQRGRPCTFGARVALEF
jgi:outer membrane receptor protein involved in Fe transport